MGWHDGIALIIGFGFVLIVIRSMFQHWHHTRSETPVKGKLNAAKEWLEENQYQVMRVRVRSEWIGFYDSREFRKQYIADFIVRKGGKYYAVKVLSTREGTLNGLKMRDLWYPLQQAFAVDGVLHLDLDHDKAHVVDFQLKSPSYVWIRKTIHRMLWLLAGMLLALMWFRG